MKLMKYLLTAALVLGPVLTHAADIKAGDLTLHQPWIKLSPGSNLASAYVVVENAGAADDTLLAVAVDGVPDAQLHQMKMEGEVMKMSEIKGGLAIPAGQTVQIWPKSPYHVMLMSLAKPFKAGETAKGRFTFAKAGKVDVEFEVMAPGSMPGMQMN